jgi:hypothetical protein
MNLKFIIMFSALTIVLIPLIVLLLFQGDYLIAVTPLASYVLGSLVLYKRVLKRVKAQYPLTAPGEPDAYFPRTNIPRPIHGDALIRAQESIELAEKQGLEKRRQKNIS